MPNEQMTIQAQPTEDFAARLMRTPQDGRGERRETTPQRDARERGEKRFNAYGCK